MKTTQDLPLDPLGGLGAPIRPTKPAAPDPIKQFEHINDQNKAVQTIADTLRKKAEVMPGAVEEWQGLDLFDAYSRAWLGCI
ncbi:MAG TPA: hypothetical protein VIN03_16595 [Roseateles sp.]